MFRAVLFDLDGTLVEFKFKWKESRTEMIHWLATNGFDTSFITTTTRTQAILDISKEQIDSREDLPDYKIVKESLMDIVNDFEVQSCLDAKPYPGTFPLLRKLKGFGIRTAVVTNSGKKAATLALENFGFSDYISFVVTRDDVVLMKPMPEGILKAVNYLGIPIADSIFVGDSVEDMRAATAAHIRKVAFARSEDLVPPLKQENPDYLIRKIDELDAILFPDHP